MLQFKFICWPELVRFSSSHCVPLTMSNSLSSVVSGLVRAQMGATLSPMVNDSDLDAHVAALILKEAKQKAERYGTEGVKAYLPS